MFPPSKKGRDTIDIGLKDSNSLSQTKELYEGHVLVIISDKKKILEQIQFSRIAIYLCQYVVFVAQI